MKFKYNGDYVELVQKTLDTLPVGTEVDFDGNEVPSGWIEIADYSTNEIDTGKKWIDGKKIYRRVFTGTTSSNGSTEIALGIIDNIINVSGYIKIDNDYKTNFNTSFGTTGSNDCRIVQHNNNFIIQTGSVLNSKDYALCLEYTKVS